MAYDMYLDTVLLPITPSKLKVTINNNNATYVLIDEGQINLLKKAKLSDVEFECCIPQVQYPFANYLSGFQPASYFLEHFEKLKTKQEPFQFIVSRTMPNGTVLFSTNMKVSMESYTLTEDATTGLDITVKIKLKQYRDFGSQSCNISLSGADSSGASTATITTETTRGGSTTGNNPSSSLPTTHTIQSGDTLWAIAKQAYGDGALYTLIASANNLSNPNSVPIGTELTIPAKP